MASWPHQPRQQCPPTSSHGLRMGTQELGQTCPGPDWAFTPDLGPGEDKREAPSSPPAPQALLELTAGVWWRSAPVALGCSAGRGGCSRARLPLWLLSLQCPSSQVPSFLRDFSFPRVSCHLPAKRWPIVQVRQSGCLTQALSLEGSDAGRDPLAPALVPGFAEAATRCQRLGPPDSAPFLSLVFQLSHPL